MIGTIRRECLDHLIVLNEAHLAAFAHIDGKPIDETWQPLLDAYHSALTDLGVLYPYATFLRDTRVNAFRGIQPVVMGLANFDMSSERAQSMAKDLISRVNTIVELLDMRGLLREESVLP